MGFDRGTDNYDQALRDVLEGRREAPHATSFYGIHDEDDREDLRAAQDGEFPANGWPQVSPEALAAALAAVHPGISAQEVASQHGIKNRSDRAALKARSVELSPPEAQIPKRNSIRTSQDAADYWNKYEPLTLKRSYQLHANLLIAIKDNKLDPNSYNHLNTAFQAMMTAGKFFGEVLDGV